MRVLSSAFSTCVGILLLLTLWPFPAYAVSLTDDFSAGLDVCRWYPNTNQPLYLVDTSGGDVRISKPAGGFYGFQSMNIDLKGRIHGNFDVSVRFSNASINRVNGSPANQVQLNIWFGGQMLCLVRDDDRYSGDNVHVYVDPPRVWRGARSNAATSGLLRIKRIGRVVTAYFNETTIYSATYNDADVTRLWFSLQNNGTVDPTSVVFDDFSLVADAITFTGCGSVSGYVVADCGGATAPLYGAIVDLFDVTGALIGDTFTLEDGSYLFSDVLNGSGYSVAVVTPLGYESVSPLAVSVAGDTQVPDVVLSCVEIVEEARGGGFWKHNVSKHLRGQPNGTQVTEEELVLYGEMIFDHFVDNPFNPIVIPGVTFVERDGAACPIDLPAMDATLNPAHATMLERAEQELLSLLLNVTSERLATFSLVSEDDRTTSQAITYLAGLICDGDDGNDEWAKNIGETINSGVLVEAGLIPETTDNYSYRHTTVDQTHGTRIVRIGPSPFEAATQLDLMLGEEGPVTVSVYDVLGRRVRTIADELRPAGSQVFVWNGIDDSGRGVAPGIYFVQVRAHSYRESRRVVVAGR